MNLAPLIHASAARGATACDECDAGYRVVRDPECSNVTHLTVLHDNDCPFYRQRTNRAGRRASGRGK